MASSCGTTFNLMPSTGRPMLDPWVLLGAIAAQTSRVRLGTMITPIPRRRPWKLAKEITTLDHLSAGRVIVGVGLKAHLNPRAVQRPRPPIWIAATLPHRKPIARAARWDGIFPLDSQTGALSAEALARLVRTLDLKEGFDVVTSLKVGVAASDLKEAGATWAVDGPAGPDEPFLELYARIQAGPPQLS
jgi:alkanesulfonate monooxygenase SsuD/methylene tetrahydromethanopterin reductase-like flavin-dependent oxidoreductase (luciferase family)